jgi:hypothetical protein
MSDQSRQPKTPPPKPAEENLQVTKSADRKGRSSVNSAATRIQRLFEDLERESVLPNRNSEQPRLNPIVKPPRAAGLPYPRVISQEVQVAHPVEPYNYPHYDSATACSTCTRNSHRAMLSHYKSGPSLSSLPVFQTSRCLLPFQPTACYPNHEPS